MRWLLLLLIVAPAAAEDLQVVAEPGLKVWLNGRYRGVTTLDEGGRFFEGLPPGHFVVKVEKSGRPPQIREGSLRRGSTAIVEFSFPDNAPPVVAATASLRVRAAPASPPATVLIDGEEVGRTPVTLGGLPPGSHALELRRRGQVLRSRVKLDAGRRGQVKGHFLHKKVVDETAGGGVVEADRGPVLTSDQLSQSRGELEAAGWRVRYGKEHGAPENDPALRLEFDPERKTITVVVGPRPTGIDDLK